MNDISEKLNELSVQLSVVHTTLGFQAKSLDKLTENQEEANKILLRNTQTVEEHHRRSLLLEAEVKRVDAEVENINEHVIEVRGVIKFAKAAIVLLGGLYSIIKILEYIGK